MCFGGWRPISVATTSSKGGAMDESEERAFAAFDVKPAASRELKKCSARSFGREQGFCLFLAGRRRVVASQCVAPRGP